MAVPEDESAYALIVELSAHLGSTDSVLRNDYGNGIPASWIRRPGTLSDDELRSLIDVWLPNLAVGVGESNKDSVLLRSFSTLNLSLLVARDNRRPFLGEEDIDVLLEGVLMYIERERDVRGWVDRLGWCNSAGHTATMLKYLARSRHLRQDGQLQVLQGIAMRLRNTGGYVFVHGEDARLAAAACSVLARLDFDPRAFEEFTAGFESTFSATPYKDGLNAASHAAQQNCKNFLRALYIRLMRIEDPTPDQVVARDLTLAALPKH